MAEDVQAACKGAVEYDDDEAEATFGDDDEEGDGASGDGEGDEGETAWREDVGEPSPEGVAERAEQGADAERAPLRLRGICRRRGGMGLSGS